MVTDEIRHEDYPLFKGHVAVGSYWVGVQVEDDKRRTCEGEFEIRILAPYPEGGWIYERMVYQGKHRTDTLFPAELRDLGIMPDENLRRLFQPMDAGMVGKSIMKRVFRG